MKKYSEYNNPTLYPWARPESSGLLVDKDYYSTPYLEDYFGDSEVFPNLTVDEVLEHHDLDPISRRYLIVSVGANASPEAMLDKMSLLTKGPTVIPFTEITIENLAVGYAGYVTYRGYIPATPYHHDGAKTTLWASYLDYEQLAILDATEPNYFRLKVSTRDYPAVMASGERIDTFYLYDSYRGVLSVDGEVIPFDTQVALYNTFRTMNGLKEVVHECTNFDTNGFRLSKRKTLDDTFIKGGFLNETGIQYVTKFDIEYTSEPSWAELMIIDSETDYYQNADW